MSLVNRFDLLDVSDDEETTVVKKTTPAPAAPAPVAGKAAVGKPATTAATPAAKQGEKKPVGKTEGQKSEKGERKPRPEGERKPRPEGERKPRPEGERQPRPEGERQPRPEGERRPRPEGERKPRPEGERKPRPEGERQPRPEGERKPRPEGERKPRPEGDRRPRVRKNEEGIEQPEESKQEGEAPKSDLPPRKRQFDRRGPPRKEGEKSEYHGKGNWGKPGSESTPETKEEKTEAEAAEGAEQAEKPVENAPVVEAEPEEKLITLAEFKKLKESQKKTVQATAARTANEGVDTSAWKNTEQFVRSEEAYYVPSNKPGDKKKAAPAERKAPEVIEFVPKPLIEDKFRDRRFDDKRRGKGPRSRVPEPPKLDDKSAFPSLK